MTVRIRLAAMLCAIPLLLSCGGGGSSNSSSSSSSSLTLSGVASAGAAIVDASISILSSNGQYYNPTTTTGSDGSFQLSLDKTSYPAPLLIRISKTTGQSIGTYYSYATPDNATGLVITPLSTAVVGLAADTNLDRAFKSGSVPSSLSISSVTDARNQVAKVLEDKLAVLGVSSAVLLNNSTYSANGTGQDLILDSFAFKQLDDTTGKVMISSKLSGKSVQIEKDQRLSNITKIPSSQNSVNLINEILSKINQVNTCIKNAVNQNTSNPNCLDDNFKDSGLVKSQFIGALRDDVGTFSSIGKASIVYCKFDDSSKSFDTGAASLANATGLCNASFEYVVADETGVVAYEYKFTVNSSGTSISDVKGYGNQLEDSLNIAPQILVKKRVDGFTTNIGVTSGYAIDIGTAKDKSTKNLSAKVEINDSSNNNLQTLYLQCQQGTSCQNSSLTLCKSNSPTCAAGYDTTVDSVVSVSTTLAQAIIQALQSGFVTAKITAYNKLLSDNSKTINFTKTVPVAGVPVAQNVASNLIYPSLNSDGVALKTWAGEDSLTLGFDRGDAKIALYNASFGTGPSANYTSRSKNISGNVTSVTFEALRKSNSLSMLNLNGCPPRAGEAYYRSLYLSGSFNNVEVIVKTFGSCYADDY